MLCVVLSVKTLIVAMQRIVLLSVMLSVVILGAIMLNVVASFTSKINCKLLG